MEEIKQMPEDRQQRQLEIGLLDENKTLKEAETFFEREFNAKIHTYREDDPQRHDPKRKAELARPYRPAIYIEQTKKNSKHKLNERLYLGNSQTMTAWGPWPSMDKASAFYCLEKEKAEDPGFKSPRARHFLDFGRQNFELSLNAYWCMV